MAIRPWILCSQLLKAIQANDIQTAEELFDGGLDVDSIIYAGHLRKPAICLCVEKGYFQMAKMLIRKGCSLSLTTGSGNTPLHLAAMKSDVQFVRLLLDNRANVKSLNNQRQTALHIACRGSSIEILRLLVSKGCNVNKPDIDGNTPLSLACNKSCVSFIRYLLQKGSNVNVVDSCGNSPILHAIGGFGCSTELLSLLLNAGAEINHKNKWEETPLLRAIHCRSPFRIQDPRSLEVRIAIVKLLIDAGSDVNATNSFGQTSLHLAIFENDVDLVREILNAGCNVDVADEVGNFPLFYACRDGRIALAMLLVEAGADLHKQNWLRCETYNTFHNTREILDYLKQKSHEFPRLDYMCRTVVRKYLGRRLEMVLPKLKLPHILSKYIRLIDTNFHMQ